MSQHDLTIANQGFPAFRADLNDALQALGSCQSGTSAPSPTFANQLWYDTTNNILKIRNEDNDAWISIATLDQSGDLVALLVANTVNSVGDSTISGLTVGKGGGAVATNTAAGYQALNGSNSGDGQNAAFGYQALFTNTTGNENTAIGTVAAYSNTTGRDNTIVGDNAFYANTTGSSNTAVGRQALQANTTASNNTAVGYKAGYSNTTGIGNTFLGAYCGYSTTGNCNTFVSTNGPNGSAGYFVTTGTKNTILGAYNGNQGGLDIRTLSNYVVLSDGDGNPQATMYQGGSFALSGATPKAGTGITFPATQSASSDANTLDDYEEGTWTPTMGGSTTYNNRAGYYTKIGNIVYAYFLVNISAIGTGSTALIDGLPFASARRSEGSISYFSSTSLAVVFLSPKAEGTTIAFLGTTAATSFPTDGIAIFGNNTYVIGAVTYSVS